jgi:hypothetical protein
MTASTGGRKQNSAAASELFRPLMQAPPLDYRPRDATFLSLCVQPVVACS